MAFKTLHGLSDAARDAILFIIACIGVVAKVASL
jgi:hypothetical protein